MSRGNRYFRWDSEIIPQSTSLGCEKGPSEMCISRYPLATLSETYYGTLDELLGLAPHIRVILLTPTYLVQEFHLEFERERVLIQRHEIFSGSGYTQRALTWLCRRVHRRWLRGGLLSLGNRQVTLEPQVADTFREYPTDLIV